MKPKCEAIPGGSGQWLRGPLSSPRGLCTAPGTKSTRPGMSSRKGGMLEAAEALQSSPPCAREHSVTSGYKHLEIIKNQRRRLNVLIK